MQILYGNDGTNYRTIDKSPNMTVDVERALLESYAKYDFSRTPGKYSSVENEPEAITYVTSNMNLSNRFRRDQLIVCKTGHMQSFGSPSFYFHGLIKDVGEEFFDKDFFEIFGYSFIRDRDMYRYHNGLVDSYYYESNEHFDVALTKDQLIVILAMFMTNESSGKKTRILCDMSGDRFNQRSREILYSIYRYLPGGIRKRYGFSSYSQDDRNLSGRISFVIFCKDDLEGSVSEMITLKESRADIARMVKKEYLEYAEYLVEKLDDEGREEHFKKLSGLADEGTLRIKDCVDYYSKTKQWSAGTQERCLPEWIDYIDQNSFRKGPLYDVLLQIIIDKVDNDYYNDYLFDVILRSNHETMQTLSQQAARTMRFADCLDEIFIDPGRFHEWYRDTLDEKIRSLNSSNPSYMQERYNLYKEETEFLRQADIMCEELKSLLKREIEENEILINDLSDDLEGQADAEKAEIGEKIHRLKSLEEFSKSIGPIVESIRFDINKEDINIEVDEWLTTNLLGKSFTNLKDVGAQQQAFDSVKRYASKEMAKKCEDHLHSEQDRLIIEQRSREFSVKTESVLEQYDNLISSIAKGQLDEQTEITVIFGDEKILRKVIVLKSFLSFVLHPSEDTYKQLDNGLKKHLISLNCTSGEHARYLISDQHLNKEWKNEIIDRYLKGDPVTVSGAYLADLVLQHCNEMCDNLISKYSSFEKYEDEKGLFVRKLKASGAPYQREPENVNKKKGLFGHLFQK